MNQQNSGSWPMFALGIVIAIFLVWFGLQFLFFDNQASPGVLFLLGIGFTLGGVFTLTSFLPKKIYISGALIVAGLYYFGRASGQIEGAWIAKLLGIASLVAAVLVVYVFFPKPQPPSEKEY